MLKADAAASSTGAITGTDRMPEDASPHLLDVGGVVVPVSKTCRRCGEIKMLSLFYRGTALYGRHPWCKPCYSAWKQARRIPKRPPPLPEGLRRCSRCKTVKSLTEFYRNPVKAKGRANYCKPCHAEASASTTRRYRQSEHCRERMRTYLRGYQRQRRRDPVESLKDEFRRLTNIAIRFRLLIPEPCEECGAAAVQAHHEEYELAPITQELSRAIAEALRVRWFCHRDHQMVAHGGAWNGPKVHLPPRPSPKDSRSL